MRRPRVHSGTVLGTLLIVMFLALLAVAVASPFLAEDSNGSRPAGAGVSSETNQASGVVYRTAVRAAAPMAYLHLDSASFPLRGPLGTVAAVNGQPQPVSGVVEGALAFDAADDEVVLRGVGPLSRLEQFSAELWFRWDGQVRGGTEDWGTLLARGSWDQGPLAVLVSRASTPQTVNVYVEGRVVASHQAELGRDWHHLVVTHDGQRVSLYLDGRRRENGGSALPSSTLPLRFGRSGGQTAPSYPWGGAMDEIALYDQALDAATVATHYQALRD